MKTFSLMTIVLLVGCGSEVPLVEVPSDQVEVVDAGGQDVPPEVVVLVPPLEVLVLDSGTPPVEETDAGLDLPGKSGENNRCDAGQGKKLGLIKHGKCE